ncbi:MAG: fibronectin type III domain-containing protein, partial [Chthoniobacterales bacterium]
MQIMPRSFLATAFLLCLGIFSARASTTVLANPVSFREAYADRIVATPEEGAVSYDQIATGSFTARGKLILTAEDLDGINENTPISISVGGWSFEASLNDDPRYVPGKQSARFLLDGGALTIAWAAGRSSATVTWSVKAKTGSCPGGDELQESPVAAELGDGENAIITLDDQLKAVCEVNLAGISAYSEVPLSGAVRYNLKTAGTGDETAEFDLKSCTVLGSGVMRLTAPPTPTPPTFSSVTSTGFTVNWGAVSGATSYRLDVSSSSSFASYVTQDLTVIGTSQAVTGLSPGTTYYAR